MNIVLLVPFVSFIALLFAIILYFKISKQSEGSDLMKEIAGYIRQGSSAYLNKQYFTVSIFFVIVFSLLFLKAEFIDFSFMGNLAYLIPFSFLSGGFFSALAGFFGMKIATYSNNRTAAACQSSLNKGLRVAFNSGTIMGMLVVGLALFHLSLWYFILDIASIDSKSQMDLIMAVLLPSAFGASAMALFARVGGGIFTKAADVGADLVGKVEVGIPEDDPRNPASIADNVGDNVGDVAGMGADLYESYIASIIATMAVAVSAFEINDNYMIRIASPMILAAIGVLSSIIGSFFVKTSSSVSSNSLLWSLRKGIYIASFIMILVSFFFINNFLDPVGFKGMGVFFSILIGLLVGNLIGYSTEYYTATEYSPTKKLASQAKTGPATIIIAGLALGSISTFMPIIIIVFGTFSSFFIMGGFENFSQGLYGIGMASVGMLSTLGITLATDAYGPVADNAGGIAEMSNMPPEVRERTDALDSLGNTTAATGKGFAIGSAALTALMLLVAYVENIKLILLRNGFSFEEVQSKISTNLTDPFVISGLFLGAMLPFYFSALTMSAVGRAAGFMVEEVRRQFKEIPGIMERKSKPDYARCVSISTLAAQKEMIAPALIATTAPIIIGLIFGVKTVIALLAGSLVSGFVLAVMMANAGGAWDNAKKYIEKGFLGGKGSEAHKSAVVGDTVGDPFKDTSGPSINILLKLMVIVSIISASFILIN